MKQVTRRTKPGEFTGWHMLMCMIAFFGVIIAANVTMAVLANRTWPGLIAKNGYVASQDFNKKLAHARALKAQHWRSSLQYRAGKIHFTLRSSDNKPVVFARMTLKIGRPAGQSSDLTLPLRYEADGRYSADIALQAGVWALEIMGEKPGAPHYRRESRLLVQANGSQGEERNKQGSQHH